MEGKITVVVERGGRLRWGGRNEKGCNGAGMKIVVGLKEGGRLCLSGEEDWSGLEGRNKVVVESGGRWGRLE